jgi:TFIIF-interacting CTD phosphatase-like protein
MYRQHALPYGPIFVKDLSRIGRDLSKTIIVDNVAENFQLQPDNGIFIKSWFDDMSDTALSELAPLLKGKQPFIVNNKPNQHKYRNREEERERRARRSAEIPRLNAGPDLQGHPEPLAQPGLSNQRILSL